MLLTPLHSRHVALGARMMPFAGYDMPVQYAGIIEEHLAVRRTAGLFDVSHMGEVFVRGPQAFDFVQQLVSNDAARLYDGRAMYSVMCRPDGGIVDDLLVYRFGPEEYLLVINAANVEKDVAWMAEHNPVGASLENVSNGVALLAIQGPRAAEVFSADWYPLPERAFDHRWRPEGGIDLLRSEGTNPLVHWLEGFEADGTPTPPAALPAGFSSPRPYTAPGGQRLVLESFDAVTLSELDEGGQVQATTPLWSDAIVDDAVVSGSFMALLGNPFESSGTRVELMVVAL